MKSLSTSHTGAYVGASAIRRPAAAPGCTCRAACACACYAEANYDAYSAGSAVRAGAQPWHEGSRLGEEVLQQLLDRAAQGSALRDLPQKPEAQTGMTTAACAGY